MASSPSPSTSFKARGESHILEAALNELVRGMSSTMTLWNGSSKNTESLLIPKKTRAGFEEESKHRSALREVEMNQQPTQLDSRIFVGHHIQRRVLCPFARQDWTRSKIETKLLCFVKFLEFDLIIPYKKYDRGGSLMEP